MPQLPDAVQGPNIDIDIDQKHLVELIDMEETPSKYRDVRKDAMTIIWKFNVWNLATGVAVIDDNTGLMWEHWGFTPDGTWRNKTTGKASKAREWTEALIGRELSDEEMKQLIASGFREGLLNHKAVADFEWYLDANGIQKIRIMRLRPYKPASTNGSAPKKTEPEPVVAGGVQETKEERRARLQREMAEMDQE
jgi:hypothetical protein